MNSAIDLNLSLVTIFGAGLLTFASPCVLPLMPVYLATIVGDALDRARPWRTLRVAGAFTAGFALVFTALGALATGVGKLLLDYQRSITLLSGALMIAFALRSFGVLRVALFDRDVRPAMLRVRAVSGAVGAFVFGAAFALGWSPCIGPVLASVLTYTATHAASPWRGAGYLAAYSAGLAVPMLLLAAVAPRALAWVRSVRVTLPLLEKITGAALLAVGIWTIAHAPSAPSPTAAVAEPPAATAQATCDQAGAGHTCALAELDQAQPSSDLGAGEESLVQPGAQLLEFGAHDCSVCQRMRPVLDRLVAACIELDNLVVHVDVATSQGRALATRYGVRGTPTYVLVSEDGVERERLHGETTEAQIAGAIERNFGLSCAS